MPKNYDIKTENVKDDKEFNTAFKMLVNLLKKNFEDCDDIQVSSNYCGNANAPSQKKKSYRLWNAKFTPDAFDGLSDALNNFTFLTIGFRKIKKKENENVNQSKKD